MGIEPLTLSLGGVRGNLLAAEALQIQAESLNL